MTLKNRKIAATMLALPTGFERDVIVEVNHEGRIEKVSRGVKDMDSISGVEFYSGLLCAGFVNCHCHLEYSYLKGRIAQGGGLAQFVKNIMGLKADDSLSEEFKVKEAKKWDAIMWHEGVVAVADHNNNDYVMRLKKNSPIYYHTFCELYNMPPMSSREVFASGVVRAEAHQREGLAASVSFHATYSMEEELMRAVAGADNKGLLSIHLRECTTKGGEGELASLMSAVGSVGRELLLVHNTYLTKGELDALCNTYGSAITFVMCPSSNKYINNCMPNYDMFKDKGVRVTLGTDSLSSNTHLSILNEIRCVLNSSSSVSFADTLKWATCNGAEALGISDWAGSIEVGKSPGLVLLEGFDFVNKSLSDETSAKRII